MGLALIVGTLADLKEFDEEGYAWELDNFAKLNDVLRAEGLDEHVEPEDVDETFSCDMLSYSGIHYLRRIAVHLALGKPIPDPGNGETYRNTALSDEYFVGINAGKDMRYQHLIVHSDAEGFYVPIDFQRVIGAPAVKGHWVGSTQRLQAECAELAGMLGMPVEMHYESDELHRAVNAQLDPGSQPPRRPWPWRRAEAEGASDLMWKRYAVETYACLRLLAACDVSLRNKAAIVFC